MVLILYFFWGYTLNKLVYLSKPKQAIFSLSRAGISGKKRASLKVLAQRGY